MITMLERAAGAAYEAYHDPTDEPLWDQIARAVLLAVREPDDHLTYKAGWHFYDYSDQFTAMIDAILNETPK